MMGPSLAIGGSGGGNGAPGKSAELRREADAIEWRQTGGEWQELVPLEDITGPAGEGTPGSDGKSVELQKGVDAIEWRQTPDGSWQELVPLEEIKGEPGDAGATISDNALNGYVDTGNMRQAWGQSDFTSLTEQEFLFPAEFAVPPTVQLTRGSVGPALRTRKVTTTGFTIDRGELRGNPVPFSWNASGLKAGASVPAAPARFDVDKLPTFSAAIRALQSGVAYCPRILCIGDSTTAGFGANAASAVTNDKANAYPTYLAKALSAKGLPATWASWIGNGNTPQFNTYDHRIAFASGWGLSNWDDPISIGHTLGGFALRTGVTQGQSKLTFDTLTPVDTVEIYFLMRQPAVVTNFVGFIVDVDGADVGQYTTSFDNNNPGGLFKVTHTMSLARHTIGIRSLATTDNVYCMGMIAYAAANNEVSVVNCGWGTSKAVDWNNQQGRTWGPLKALAAVNPDLVILNLGINDCIQDHPSVGGQRVQKEFFMRDMQAIVDAARNSGSDVLVMVPNQIGAEYAGWMNRFIPFIQELASRNSLPLISIPDLLGSTWDAANAAGYMRDRAHPNATGYSVVANAIANLIYPV